MEGGAPEDAALVDATHHPDGVAARPPAIAPRRLPPSLPPPPDLRPITGISEIAPPARTRPPATFALQGRWRQVGGGSGADFAPGGHVQGQLDFRLDGTLLVTRWLDAKGERLVVKELAFDASQPGKLLLGPPGDASRQEVVYALNGGRLDIAGKAYTKQR